MSQAAESIGHRIRVAVPEDATAISALLSASYSLLMRDGYEDGLLARLLPLITQANPRLLRSGTYFVAVDGDRIKGCGGWTRERPGTGEVLSGTGHIRHFGTDPACTRRGIARALMVECVRTARAAGMVRLECLASLNAAAFYESQGFVTRARVAVPLPGGVIMPALDMNCEI